MRVLLQLRPPTEAARDASFALRLADAALGGFPQSFALDTGYEPVPIPAPVAEEPGADRFSLVAPRSFSDAPTEATTIVRGHIPEGAGMVRAIAELQAHHDVVGVFS